MIVTQAIQNPHHFSHHTHYIHCLVFARLSIFIHDTQIAPYQFFLIPGQLVAPPPPGFSYRAPFSSPYFTYFLPYHSACHPVFMRCSLFALCRTQAKGNRRLDSAADIHVSSDSWDGGDDGSMVVPKKDAAATATERKRAIAE